MNRIHRINRVHRAVALVAVTAVALGLAAPGVSSTAPATAADAPPLEPFGNAWGPATRGSTAHLEALGAGTDPADGRGVGIALIDTGVSRGLAASGGITTGPDFSADGDGVDRHGHGTFLAGLLVGDRDAGVRGVSPGAQLISVKVTGADGLVDNGTVMRAIDWVIASRDRLGIRVLVLALGHATDDSYAGNPLNAALEAAWASGIVVVVPTGNLGDGRVTAPGDDPWLVSVGASDGHATRTVADDVVAAWSGRGAPNGYPRPDVVAPGTSLVSVRAPGSTLDRTYGDARQTSGRFRGSGTSLAAALVGGLAANIIEDRPTAGPNDVKYALVSTAQPIGGGVLPSLPDAVGAAPAPADWQQFPTALTSWDGTSGSWTGTSWTGTSWTGTFWTGTSWTGTSWTGTSWTGTFWTGTSWTGTSWTGQWSATQ